MVAGSQKGSFSLFCFCFLKCSTQRRICRTAGGILDTDALPVLGSWWADSEDKLVQSQREGQVVLLNKLTLFSLNDLIVYYLSSICFISLLETPTGYL